MLAYAMARATPILATTTLAALALAGWLYTSNRALRAQLAHPAAIAPPPDAPGPVAARPGEPTPRPARSAAIPRPAPPAIAEPPEESRMERRARRTEEVAAMLGRLDGESEADYKARVGPLIAGGLLVPRIRVDEQRRIAEDKAHVTPAQSAQLDQAFAKVYGEVLDYANKAIGDGQLSPYERNVAGWLEFAGGLGGILGEANGQIAKVLEPAQLRAMSDAGFEWGEYLGVKAPWEQLRAPPPPPVRR
jgi:hypothetical protein